MGETDRCCRDLAGQADEREGIAPVWFDVDVKDDVAEQVGQRPTDRRLRGQDEDPLGVSREAELVARAEHPVAHHPELLRPFDLPPPGQDGAREGDRNPLPGGDVPCPANDLPDRAVANRHPSE